MTKIRVLVAGLGTMGLSHARAYRAIEGFELAGLCTNRHETRGDLRGEFPGVPLFGDFAAALAAVKPDAVSINTYTQSHADYCLAALAAGCHVFCEKPLAATIGDAGRVVAAAKRAGKQLLIGYILRVHPAWRRFVEIGRTLGKPLVMRMNLNQQSSGAQWAVHKALMQSTSPIVDCGVHYIDVMCQAAEARPVSVHAVGARLTSEVDAAMYNYGPMHIAFDDGSVGWYEAGWGPMMSETAFFVKDMIGPKGSVSLIASAAQSADHEGHTSAGALRLHHAGLAPDGGFLRPDDILAMPDDPGHQGLCDLEQQLFLDCIMEDRDLTRHHAEALSSLRVVFAADASMRSGRVVYLD